MAGGYEVGSKLCVDRDELRAAVNDLDPVDLASILNLRGRLQPRRIAPYRSSAAVWNEMNASQPAISGA